MRLIDADALIEAFKVKSGIWTETSKYLIGVIENQPTAYDVEKVVAELEQQAEQYRNRGFEYEKHGYSAMADTYYAKQCSYLHAIDIVKAGGVE